MLRMTRIVVVPLAASVLPVSASPRIRNEGSFATASIVSRTSGIAAKIAAIAGRIAGTGARIGAIGGGKKEQERTW